MYYDIKELDLDKHYIFLKDGEHMQELTNLTLTIDELDELISAEGTMYMDYDESRSDQYNESIRRYNDNVEALLNKLKAAYKLAKEKEDATKQ